MAQRPYSQLLPCAARLEQHRNMNIRVAMVVDKIPLPDLLRVVKAMPVWLREGVVDADILVDLRDAASYGVTTFKAVEGEIKKDMIARTVTSLDEHYSEVSQSPAYRELEVLGAAAGDVDEAVFNEYGFRRFKPSVLGFIAYKG